MDRFNVIETIFSFDNHRKSDKDRALSTSQLISANYKAWKDLNKADKDRTLPVGLKRSSTLGTGYHLRAEEALADNPDVIQEIFTEKYVEQYKTWISGTFDILINDNGLNYLGDHKTFYGKTFQQVDKTIKQLSIYRWLNQDIKIEDKAYIYAVSQSNNHYETIEVELMSIEDTEAYILDTLEIISTEPSLDCFIGIKYNPCVYCEYACDFRKS